jgi:hypothetical protein
MDGTGRVMDGGAMRGMDGVVGATWGTTEVVGAAWGAAEVDKACDKEAVKGRVV